MRMQKSQLEVPLTSRAPVNVRSTGLRAAEASASLRLGKSVEMGFDWIGLSAWIAVLVGSMGQAGDIPKAEMTVVAGRDKVPLRLSVDAKPPS